MVMVNLKNLVSRLDMSVRKALEAAAGSAMARGHHDIEIEHWFQSMLSEKNKELGQVIDEMRLDRSRIGDDLQYRINGFRTGNDRQPGLSTALVQLAESAWLLASIDYRRNSITAIDLLLAELERETTKLGGESLSREFENISVEGLKKLAGQVTSQVAGEGGAAGEAGADIPTEGGALDKYTINLTAQAREGKLDPVIGRHGEIRKAIDILCRRRQNNPLLVGDPGTGKTAIVEGLAQAIVAGEVPDRLKGVQLRTLDLALLQAGASIKGEFENRLKDVIREVQQGVEPVIVFIDEAHTLIGAGGASGQHDAANLLKPALARGEFRTVAATTWAEYHQYMEKDQALARRFQTVRVSEPTSDDCVQILRGLTNSLESHHGIRVLEEAMTSAVNLTIRYLPSRRLPDKAISVLDTACSRVALARHARPERIEELEQEIRRLEQEVQSRGREALIIEETGEKLPALNSRLEEVRATLESLREQWETEQKLVAEMTELQETLDGQYSEGLGKVDEEVKNRYLACREELNKCQGDQGLMTAVVSEEVIADVLASWTGIPLGNIVSDEMTRLRTLEDRLAERVIGQKHALSALGESLRVARAGLTDPNKPIGVLFFCGPSGTGKTETGLALADILFSGEQDLVTINMSEFKEEHKVSMLLGAPAGYVGYGEGGVLTEAVRRNPYCILMLDEFEKAHPGVHDIFYRIFDKGRISDSEGREVDFRNTLIILTSNAAAQDISEACEGDEESVWPQTRELLSQIRPTLEQYFKPAFLGRIETIPYYPLTRDQLKKIGDMALNKLEKRVVEHYGASFSCDDSVVEHLVDLCDDPNIGARAIEHAINRVLLPNLAQTCIARLGEREEINNITVHWNDVVGAVSEIQ
ncbi:type VI secretion system ATPase TssH [Sansalvadorimonas sp. 2012CJ34-2]|uniref:Type VI secretion system ATPase TssH n=1 Tax=Parendozoicomonas callyspongiae TaxID=2942213 RepID=A0ABT0PIA7_9GAMM|nr:type VI secretion system ATPase TssH [Sansalvadorimonas sp. 2012CJ34-2]MCL6271107.1 type VI secretion system ATPase TssH [Sansalvadorimonas sp. 2012CJ34-2]